MLNGSCLCGEVRYRLKAKLEKAGYCHCSMCRKWSGAACLAYAGVPVGDFEWVSGEPALNRYRSSAGYWRMSCGKCGSSIVVWPTDPAERLTWVMLGTLDDAPDVRPGEHIFVASMAPWHRIADDLKQFEGFPIRATE
jgi:hypothetical protein